MFEFIEDEALREQAEGVVKAQIDEVKSGMQDQITAAVSEATKGLKENHDKLLDEKKKLQKTYEGITDPQEALEALKLISENEEMKLLAEGKFEEVVEKRLSEKTGVFETELNALQASNQEAVQRADKFQGLYENKLVTDAIRDAAAGAKVEPHAVADALLHGQAVFTVAEDGSVEARGKDGKLSKDEDGRVLTPALWIEGRKKVSPHWWPKSEGGDLNPGEDFESLDAQMRRAADKGDTALYRKLKAKKQKATR